MAKEDFCFTYYDGDAARDTTHMNRLERGAYHDLVISQRKFGHLTLDQIKKVLGRDFEECWPSLELILQRGPDEKFFIEWLDASITKMRKQSAKQRQNVTKRYQTSTNDVPNTETVTPLEDGNGNENEGEKEKEGGVGETVGFHLSFYEPDIPGDDIWFPIDTPVVRDLWAKWKECRWKNYQIRYKYGGEQAALKSMQGMSYEQIDRTIMAAIAGNWKNLHPEHNGKSTRKDKQSELLSGFAQRVQATASKPPR